MNCRTCGVPVVPPSGKPGPFRFCSEHAPKTRAAAARCYAKHRAKCLAYRRKRGLKPAVVNGACQQCGGPVPPYAGRHRARTFCSTRCRNRAADRKRSPRHRAARVEKEATS